MNNTPGGFDWDGELRSLQGQETIRDLALQVARYDHEAIEEMVERMLVSPIPCGIVVVISEIVDFDDFKASSTRQYRLDPHVPFGRLYEFPSMQAYERWQERGHPGLR